MTDDRLEFIRGLGEVINDVKTKIDILNEDLKKLCELAETVADENTPDKTVKELANELIKSRLINMLERIQHGKNKITGDQNDR